MKVQAVNFDGKVSHPITIYENFELNEKTCYKRVVKIPL